MIATSGFLAAPECTKFIFGQSSTLDSAGGAYDAPPGLLVGWGGHPFPTPHPSAPQSSRLRCSELWTLRLQDTSPTGQFAYCLVISPTGHFAYWTFRLLPGQFAYIWLFILLTTYCNLAFVGSSLCTHYGLLRAKISKIFVHQWLTYKNVVGTTPKHQRNHIGGSPIPR